MNIIEASKSAKRVRPKPPQCPAEYRFKYWSEWVDDASRSILEGFMECEWEAEEKKVVVTADSFWAAWNKVNGCTWRNEKEAELYRGMLKELGFKD